MDFTTRGTRLALALLVALPLVDVGHAAANGPLQEVLTHRPVSTNVVGKAVLDPTCPWSTPGIDPNDAVEERKARFEYVFRTRTGRETLYVSECYEDVGGGHPGGQPVNGGTWTIARSDGTVSGYIAYGGTSAFNDGYGDKLLLVVQNGTGTLAGAKGKLYYWSCSNNFGAQGGGIRLTDTNWELCRT